MSVTFSAYRFEQVKVILEKRLADLPFTAFEPKALELCARVSFTRSFNRLRLSSSTKPLQGIAPSQYPLQTSAQTSAKSSQLPSRILHNAKAFGDADWAWTGVIPGAFALGSQQL